jgi:hypothetical protein
MLLGDSHIATLQGAVPSANFFLIIMGVMCMLFPSFHYEKMQSNVCYIPSFTREYCVISLMSFLFGIFRPLRLQGSRLWLLYLIHKSGTGHMFHLHDTLCNIPGDDQCVSNVLAFMSCVWLSKTI